jgi:hypothetical protein
MSIFFLVTILLSFLIINRFLGKKLTTLRPVQTYWPQSSKIQDALMHLVYNMFEDEKISFY